MAGGMGMDERRRLTSATHSPECGKDRRATVLASHARALSRRLDRSDSGLGGSEESRLPTPGGRFCSVGEVRLTARWWLLWWPRSEVPLTAELVCDSSFSRCRSCWQPTVANKTALSLTSAIRFVYASQAATLIVAFCNGTPPTGALRAGPIDGIIGAG
jgi:hypothetical protein